VPLSTYGLPATVQLAAAAASVPLTGVPLTGWHWTE
jgi:hypothetical protein